ncbi:hypothetical protein Hanom_Chr04g00312571 [Helianthus anomalus]
MAASKAILASSSNPNTSVTNTSDLLPSPAPSSYEPATNHPLSPIGKKPLLRQK